MTVFRTKSCDLSVKDVNPKGRTVQIYVSAFGNRDSDGDIIIQGAFKKTIAETGPNSPQPRIKHLRQHMTDRLIGKPSAMVEDAKGLLVTSVLADTTEGNDALKLYEMDLFEHSIGFRVVRGEPDPESGDYIMRELTLREYSSVTWGANSETPLVGMKSLTKADQLGKLSQRMQKLAKALHIGSLTDDAYEMLELEIEQLEKAYNDLIAPLLPTTPPTDVTERKGSKPDDMEVVSYLKTLLT